jgi:hypothetical protein
MMYEDVIWCGNENVMASCPEVSAHFFGHAQAATTGRNGPATGALVA